MAGRQQPVDQRDVAVVPGQVQHVAGGQRGALPRRVCDGGAVSAECTCHVTSPTARRNSHRGSCTCLGVCVVWSVVQNESRITFCNFLLNFRLADRFYASARPIDGAGGINYSISPSGSIGGVVCAV